MAISPGRSATEKRLLLKEMLRGKPRCRMTISSTKPFTKVTVKIPGTQPSNVHFRHEMIAMFRSLAASPEASTSCNTTQSYGDRSS